MKKILLFLFSSSFCCFAQDFIVNPPYAPQTCNGDLTFLAGAIYWNTHEDGLEYAILNSVAIPVINPDPEEIDEINNLIDDDFIKPKSKWEFGFRFGINYTFACDGWDVDLVWTHFSPFSSNQIEADPSEGHTLVALWSAFAPAQGEVNFARRIQSNWKIKLDLIDFELGRAFWVSKRLSSRPFIGFRYILIRQNLDLEYSGGSWSPRLDPPQDPLIGLVDLKNDFRGGGLRSGLETIWNVDCGWGIYGLIALSLIYGRFDLYHCEENRLAIVPYSKMKVLDSRNHFRVSRPILDWNLGIQWSRMFCNCQYIFLGRFGWEQHLFFHQNQLWRVTRIGDTGGEANGLTGENVFVQTKGNLDTGGWMFTVQLAF